MAVHLITGYKGSEHIQSKDARSFNTAMFGTGEFVMEVGEQFDASIINNNTVRILDGDLLLQGGHVRLETNEYEDITITTGTAGTNRYDLIVMTYEKNANDGTEKAYLEVLKGTESEGTPSDPDYIEGDLASGDTKSQMPLYRVHIEGVVLASLDCMFNTIPTYKALAEQYEAEFITACQTYLGALNVLDSEEEIMANTLSNQLSGALGTKEAITRINAGLNDIVTKGAKMRNLNYDANLITGTNTATATFDGVAFVSAYTGGQNKKDITIRVNNKEIYVSRGNSGTGGATYIQAELPVKNNDTVTIYSVVSNALATGEGNGITIVPYVD